MRFFAANHDFFPPKLVANARQNHGENAANGILGMM
ncbi:Hypothetical protein OINT_2000149 [Brucella intermedia LMG 3301]|uniref:Uncharacterized protein n=1 Tax=Brucella intermedia LMG 3301 TaxID=641118 RepID=C4WLN7_9HYPH|nr:Hypothetical protein OINT_2000149 [Brucella intermedia LMG 3301]